GAHRAVLVRRRTGRERGDAGRCPTRAGAGRRDDAARRALHPDDDVHRPGRPAQGARRVGRGRRPRVRRRSPPRRCADRGAGLAAADATQLIAFAGFLALFFFLTLYMQNVLGYSPIQTGASYLPLCVGVGIAAGVTAQLLARTGTRPVIVAGCLIAAGGVYYLSRIPVHGSYLTDLLPGMMIMS